MRLVQDIDAVDFGDFVANFDSTCLSAAIDGNAGNEDTVVTFDVRRTTKAPGDGQTVATSAVEDDFQDLEYFIFRNLRRLYLGRG